MHSLRQRRQQKYYVLAWVLSSFGGASTTTAAAGPVRVEFVAVIESIGDVFCQCIPTNVAEGDTLIGCYYVDSQAPDTDPSPNDGLYAHTAPPYGIVVIHPDYVWETDTTSVDFRVTINNDAVAGMGFQDRYTGNSYSNRPDEFLGLPLNLIRITLRDGTASAIDSDGLPIALELGDWPTSRTLDVYGYQGEWQVRAEIIAIFNAPTAVRDRAPTPALKVIYPNPFTHAVSIEFETQRDGGDLAIYDVSGRLVRTLFQAGSEPEARLSRVTWDGTTASGSNAASGVYFCVLRSGSQVEARRIVLVR